MMYLTNLHNCDIRLNRSKNKGVFNAKYATADELADYNIELRPPICDDVEDPDVPSILNFLPADIFRSILQQQPPTLSDISVAFPLQSDFQTWEEMVRTSKASLFMADPKVYCWT